MSENPGVDPTPYDAVLLLSFGGPEGPEDVLPFLENVTRGRGVPRERLEEVGQHYHLFGGRSPINDQNRALRSAIREDFAGAGLELPVYWGNRNWDPFLVDAVREMAKDGVRRVAVLPTSAYSSYSSCRQYREDLADAVAAVATELGEADVPRLDRLRQYFNHPGFVEPVVDATLAAMAELPDAVREDARLVFVTHSVPTRMAETSGPEGDAYVSQHQSVASEVVDRVREETGRRHRHDLVYCSRSGSPRTPWLEPDIGDHLRELAGDVAAVVMVPIGFVSDHMEVIYDLDTEAMAVAEEVGITAVRAATPGVDPRFVRMVRDLLLERATVERGDEVVRASVGAIGPWPEVCAAGCCPNPRGPRPALCGRD